jgi:hypothetical protein
MPNFDRTGPLKRGRMIGRGLGPCGKNTDCSTCDKKEAKKNPDEKSATT